MPAKKCAIKSDSRYPCYIEYHPNGRIDICPPECGPACASREWHDFLLFTRPNSLSSASFGATCETVKRYLDPWSLPEDGLIDFRVSTTSVRKRKSEYAMELERKEKESKFTEYPRDDGHAQPAMRRRLRLRFCTKRGRERYGKVIAKLKKEGKGD